MKNFILIFILISASTFCQNVIVEYEGIINLKDTKNSDYNKLFNKIKESNLKFTLKFNDSMSVFEKNEILSNENKDILVDKLSESMLYYKNTFYFKKNKIILQEVEPNIFTKDTINYNWIITTESKKINNYECLKASTSEVITNAYGKKTVRTTIAWFAPYLPYSYGPLKYMGLPGLILELEYLNVKYVAKKINLKSSFLIKDIPSGKYISRKEYRERLGLKD